VPVLLEALKDSQLRDNTLVALSHIGPAAAPALPPLIALLHEEDRSVYPDVLTALMNIGPAAQSALPSIESKRRNFQCLGSASVGRDGIGSQTCRPRVAQNSANDNLAVFLGGVQGARNHRSRSRKKNLR
jgi:hypothetical protein